MKCALIDFCGTIADFQTLAPFLEMLLKGKSKIRYGLFCNKLVKLACRLFSKALFPLTKVHFLYKYLLVRQLKNVSESEFANAGRVYYRERVKPHLIAETIELIRKLKDRGFQLVIASGGSRYYISEFAKEYHIDKYITAEIGFINGQCTGRLLHECIMDEKAELVGELFSNNGILNNFAVGITDEESDMPILNLCKTKIVVSADRHQDWVTGEMKEIIYPTIECGA